ncbi:MAG: lipase maturation factor family protein [Nitrospinae bacterium]|nr:lipase maturation factor family protein [Nitrospinota bacterium]
MDDSLYARILQGSEPVLNLLAENPFPDKPPRCVRAVLSDYRFYSPHKPVYFSYSLECSDRT